MKGNHSNSSNFILLFSCLTFLFIFGNHQIGETQKVQLGVERIDEYSEVFRGKKVGLITNQTGVDSQLNRSVDVLQAKANLVALFSPEHGLGGNGDAGATIQGIQDYRSSLPVYSLYGPTKAPTAEMLSKIDVLAFDIQDIGTRYYTYMSTMAYAMKSCKENNKTFVVFDRPNPLGGDKVEGPVLKQGFESFIGLYPIPIRHGLTIGELAKLFNEEFGIHCKLVVIPMKNWYRTMYWSDTGLPWVMTSPNIPTEVSTVLYPGMGLFGDTNVSEGVGTTRPFELVGAPWLNEFELADKMNELYLPGVTFRPTVFTPRFGPHAGEVCHGVQIHVIYERIYQPVKTAVLLLDTIRQISGPKFQIMKDGKGLDRAVGESVLRLQTESTKDMLKRWEQEAQAFKNLSRKYYLYY